VVAPIDPVSDFATVKPWTRALAQALVRAAPGRYVATASKQRRRGKIYIDDLRNGRGATAIAPYSTRARPGAPVAVPLGWDELEGMTAAPGFDLALVIARVSSIADPWAGYDAVRQRLR
jgi:bifunctional non-homologous end joining protein LigD